VGMHVCNPPCGHVGKHDVDIAASDAGTDGERHRRQLLWQWLRVRHQSCEKARTAGDSCLQAASAVTALSSWCQEHVYNTSKQFPIVCFLPQSSKLQACLQTQLLPFGKALKAFLERVTAPNAQPDKAAAELNDKSTRKVLQFVKTLAQASNTYPPAMAENIVFVLRYAKFRYRWSCCLL